jgi:hypothetical protein
MTNKCGHKMKGLKPKVLKDDGLPCGSKKAYYEIFKTYFLKKEIKESKIPTSSFLVLEVKHYNSKIILHFLLLSYLGAKLILSLNFKLMDMTKFNASFNNQ